MSATVMKSLGTVFGPILNQHATRLATIETTKASKSAVDALSVENGQTATRLTAIEAGKADKTALDTLSAQVSAQLGSANLGTIADARAVLVAAGLLSA